MTDSLDKVKQTLDNMRNNPEQTKGDLKKPVGNLEFDLERITQILDHPQQGAMFEQKFNMDISGAKANDGKVTKYETVELLADFSGKLINKGYISSSVDAATKSRNEELLRDELGKNVETYDNLTAEQKDSFLTFISVPETERQSAIQKALVNGLSSLDIDDTIPTKDLFLDIKTGKLTNIDSLSDVKTKTIAKTEQPYTPAIFKIDVVDMG